MENKNIEKSNLLVSFVDMTQLKTRVKRLSCPWYTFSCFKLKTTCPSNQIICLGFTCTDFS